MSEVDAENGCAAFCGSRRDGKNRAVASEADCGIENAVGTAEMLYSVAPSVSSYYNDRHSLTSSGLSDDGMTAYELMLTACATVRSESVGLSNGSIKTDIISDDSDFAPLAELFYEWSKNGGSSFGEIVASLTLSALMKMY